MSTQSVDGQIYRHITPALDEALTDTPMVCLPDRRFQGGLVLYDGEDVLPVDREPAAMSQKGLDASAGLVNKPAQARRII